MAEQRLIQDTIQNVGEVVSSLESLKDLLQEVGTGDDSFKLEVAWEVLGNRIEDLNGVVEGLRG